MIHSYKRHIYRGMTTRTWCGQVWRQPAQDDPFAPVPVLAEELSLLLDQANVCGNCKRLLALSQRREKAA